jgi:hypothetical protein
VSASGYELFGVCIAGLRDDLGWVRAVGVYFTPARTANNRAAQECAAVMFKEFARQDAVLLEGTQRGLESLVLGDDCPLSD